MKSFINYFYNLNVDSIRLIDDNYYFRYKNQNFVLYQIKEQFFDYHAAFELNSFLNKNNKSFYQILPNKNNEIITYYSNKKYVLLTDSVNNDRVSDYYDIIQTNIFVDEKNKLINKLDKSSWNTLWKNKVDYFELFVSGNINRFPNLNKYYNYFIGLAENAISYFEDTLITEKKSDLDKKVVSHKRIEKDFTVKQLHNPVGLVIDHPTRDLSEYLKRQFWSGNYSCEEVKHCLECIRLSDYGARLLISRLMFPSFFFDCYEKLIVDDAFGKDIIMMVDRSNEYETYLNDICKILKITHNIPEINWIKKADYQSTFTTPNTSGISFTSIDSMPSFKVTSIMLQ